MKKVKEFTKFREQYNFNYEELEIKESGIYFRNQLVEDENKKYSEGEDFINVGYNFKNSLSRVLSNLYPINFKFRGKWVSSIEGVLQGIKYKDKKKQNLVLKYAGLDAYHTRASNTSDFWGNSGKLYWQGKEIDRHSNDYQLFLDELYICASRNPIYKDSLLATGNKYLLHHIGNINKNETVLTRYEYESRINALREFLKINKK